MDYRARFFSPRLGRFLSADTVVPGVGSQHLSRYMYVRGNPARRVDPDGHMDAEGYRGGVSTDTRFVLTERQLQIVQQIATEFGIPPELLASVLNVERVYDTELFDTLVQNPYQNLVLYVAKTGNYELPCAAKIYRENAEMQMFLWETFWKPGAPGVGPGLGFGHIHTGPARQTESYFANRGLSTLLPAARDSTELWETLLSQEGNIRYVAAEVRKLVEFRIGGQWEHGEALSVHNLDYIDAQVVMEGYWIGVDSFGSGGYTLTEFQSAFSSKSTKGPLILPSWGYYQSYFSK